ncbi:srp receptor beta subunit [Diaporthe amygdali]|uniref:srp receptor beta subunit n=1 Tax=Phomopsis amygdali TaxID=1214568 RepID=UPI0022FE8037|nr:srp receptor beta subunit [Diaporthe amygdali]KAJ0116551.1 srp receptor beta subunit [Diaporthe amygdali]
MDALKDFVELIMTPSAPVFIIGGLIVLLVPILMHFWVTKSTTYTVLPSILLTGPSGAGKTSLHTLLERRASPSETHTSQTWSTIELAVSEDGGSSFRDDLDAAGATANKFLLVDTPGHGKLRHYAHGRLTAEGTQSTKLKAVVFVVDAAALSEPDVLADTASYLYDVLLALQRRMGSTRTSKAPYAIPVLVAANKADLFTALPAKLVRSNLEKELGRIRRTRSKGLLDSGAAADGSGPGLDDADDWLGEYGSADFKFDQMREFDTEVDVVSGNIIGDGPGIDAWWKWIGSRISVWQGDRKHAKN